jgi:hypothetical protein
MPFANSNIRYTKNDKKMKVSFFKGISINAKSFKVNSQKNREPLSLQISLTESNNCNLLFDIDQINSSLKLELFNNHSKKIDFEQLPIDFVKKIGKSTIIYS